MLHITLLTVRKWGRISGPVGESHFLRTVLAGSVVLTWGLGQPFQPQNELSFVMKEIVPATSGYFTKASHVGSGSVVSLEEGTNPPQEAPGGSQSTSGSFKNPVHPSQKPLILAFQGLILYKERPANF